MKKIVWLLIGAASILGLVAGFASASREQVTQVTLNAARDNTLIEDEEGALSNGAGRHFFAGRTNGGEIRRGLIAFDIAGAVPAGAQVTRVELTLHMSKTAAGAEPVALHKVLADWGESTSMAGRGEGEGAPAAVLDATWLHTFFADRFWQNPGGDFVAAPSATATVGGVGFYSWEGPGLAADVQAWVDEPGGNHGWLLAGNENTSRTSKRFDSRENLVDAQRPQLLIEFVPPMLEPGLFLPAILAN